MGTRVGKSPPILAEARQVIVLDACACRSHDSRLLHFRGPSLRRVACQCCRTALDHYRWWLFGYLLIPGRPVQAVDIVLAVFGGNLTSWARRARHVEGLVLHDKVLDPTLTRRDSLQFSWEQVGDVFSRFALSSLLASLMPTAS